MSNPEFHVCTDCGYKWRHGQNGGHNCRLRIKEQRDELLKAMKQIEGATMSMYATQSDMLKDFQDIASTAVAKAEGCVEATRQS